MPTYDYECDACQHKFEIFQNMSDELLTKCPKCQKKKLRRFFGAGSAILLKGSGSYQPDYRSDSYKKGAAADKPAESKPADSGSKSETSSSSSPTPTPTPTPTPSSNNGSRS